MRLRWLIRKRIRSYLKETRDDDGEIRNNLLAKGHLDDIIQSICAHWEIAMEVVEAFAVSGGMDDAGLLYKRN